MADTKALTRKLIKKEEDVVNIKNEDCMNIKMEKSFLQKLSF